MLSDAHVIIKDAVQSLDGHGTVQEYSLHANLSKRGHKVYYCDWRTLWTNDSVHCWADTWNSLKKFLDMAPYEIRIDVLSIRITDRGQFLLMFENTEYNLRLLGECIAE